MKSPRWIIYTALFLVMLSAVAFTYNTIILPKAVEDAQNRLKLQIDENSMPKVKAAVITAASPIAKYTVLTDAVIQSSVKIIEMPEKYAAANHIKDIGSMRGKICKEDLRPGEQIVMDSLSSEEKWFSEQQRLKEYTISGIVAGEVKTGNIVDILVNYNNGTYDVVVPKIKVYRMLDAVRNDVQKAEQAQAARQQTQYTLIFAVDEQQYADMELASKLGKLETRLYIDESQPPSVRTFDGTGAKALKQLR